MDGNTVLTALNMPGTGELEIEHSIPAGTYQVLVTDFRGRSLSSSIVKQ